LDPTKVRIAVASGAIAAVVTATLFVVFRGNDKPAKKPDEVTLAVPPAAAPPLELTPPPTPVAAPAPTPALPPPVAKGDARPSAGEITELLVTARRVENTDPKRSRELLFLALVGDPENTEALERLSKKLVTDENPRSAADLADRCLRVVPKNPECAAVKAKLPPIDPPSPAVVSQAQTCLEQNSNAVDCMYTLADNAFHQGKKENAALFAISMSRVAPESPETKYTIGRVRAAWGEYSKALPFFASACQLGNKDACFRADLLRGEGW
jgi:hypothetical protein